MFYCLKKKNQKISLVLYASVRSSGGGTAPTCCFAWTISSLQTAHWLAATAYITKKLAKNKIKNTCYDIRVKAAVTFINCLHIYTILSQHGDSFNKCVRTNFIKVSMCSFKLCLRTVEVNGLCIGPLENIQMMLSNDRNKHGGWVPKQQWTQNSSTCGQEFWFQKVTNIFTALSHWHLEEIDRKRALNRILRY